MSLCLQQLKVDNEQLQSNNDLLQVRLSSLLAMFSIQETAAAAKEVGIVCLLYTGMHTTTCTQHLALTMFALHL